MLEYIEVFRKLHQADRKNAIDYKDCSEEERSVKSEELKEIAKEKASSQEKMNKCMKNYEGMTENYRALKDYIGEINDFMIIK